jgi:hypothetical protein
VWEERITLSVLIVLVACGVGEGEGEVRYRSELAAEGEDDAELISFLFWFLINI